MGARLRDEMDEQTLLNVMHKTSTLPHGGERTIYEAGDTRGNGCGEYYIDFATYDGTTAKVPRSLIDALESQGVLRRAFPDQKYLNAWRLAKQWRKAR